MKFSHRRGSVDQQDLLFAVKNLKSIIIRQYHTDNEALAACMCLVLVLPLSDLQSPRYPGRAMCAAAAPCISVLKMERDYFCMLLNV